MEIGILFKINLEGVPSVTCLFELPIYPKDGVYDLG